MPLAPLHLLIPGPHWAWRARTPLVLALALLALGAMASLMPHADAPERPRSAPVSHGEVADTVVASGVLQADEMVSLGAQATGRVEQLLVKLGDRVKAGQLIAKIDSDSQVAAVEMVQQQLDAARAQRRAARVEVSRNALLLQRQRELMAGQGTSRESVEAAEAAHAASVAALDVAEARVREVKGSLKAATLTLGHTHLRSPIAGEVVAVMAKQGQMVNANFATPSIVKIARVSAMRIRVNLSELDVPRVKVGQSVRFATMGSPDTWRDAQLRVIEPLPVDQQRDAALASGAGAPDGAPADAGVGAVYFGAMLSADNPRGDLRVGMSVMVRIVVASAQASVRLPRAAVDELPGGNAPAGQPVRLQLQVLAANGQTETRTVQLGLRDADFVQVVSGLRVGERVLLPRAPDVPRT